ncbi:MAG: PilZ domain-containing protein [Planctomycetota bacterium]
MESAIDHRNEVRTELVWPVSIWLPEANRFFNGRSSNISKDGVFVRMPMTTPVIEGNVVELNFPRTTVLAKQKGAYSRIKSGKVVRVERKDVPVDASIGVAVEFV